MSKVESYCLCPFCKEKIKENAIKCKHCMSSLVGVSVVNQEKEIKPSVETNKENFVYPSVENNPYLGHGWSILVVSFLNFVISGSSLESDFDFSSGLTFFSSIIIVPWFIWLMTKPGSNKILPIISIAFLGLIIIALAGTSIS